MPKKPFFKAFVSILLLILLGLTGCYDFDHHFKNELLERVAEDQPLAVEKIKNGREKVDLGKTNRGETEREQTRQTVASQLRRQKTDACSEFLTLGERIHNLKIEIEIRKLRIEPEMDFHNRIIPLMFPEPATLTVHGRKYQVITKMILDREITEQHAVQELDALDAEWCSRQYP